MVNLLEATLAPPAAQTNIQSVETATAPAPQQKPKPPPPGRPRAEQNVKATAAASLRAFQQTTLPVAAEGETTESMATILGADQGVTSASSQTADTAAATLPAEPVETGTQRYRREQFVFIRERVMAQLVYPPLARRQGWAGEVQVEFTVCADGTVENLRVVATSGRALLDQQALRAVQAAAPFPPPPARVNIALPVCFTTETTRR